MLTDHARTLLSRNFILGFHFLFVDRVQILQRSCDHQTETHGTRWNTLEHVGTFYFSDVVQTSTEWSECRLSLRTVGELL